MLCSDFQQYMDVGQPSHSLMLEIIRRFSTSQELSLLLGVVRLLLGNHHMARVDSNVGNYYMPRVLLEIFVMHVYGIGIL